MQTPLSEFEFNSCESDSSLSSIISNHNDKIAIVYWINRQMIEQDNIGDSKQNWSFLKNKNSLKKMLKKV